VLSVDVFRADRFVRVGVGQFGLSVVDYKLPDAKGLVDSDWISLLISRRIPCTAASEDDLVG
jgi:hypothetical protein